MDAISEAREKFKEKIAIIFTDGPYGSSQDVTRLLNRLITLAYTGLKHQSSLQGLEHHKEVEIEKGDIEALSLAASLNQQVTEYITTYEPQHINTPTHKGDIEALSFASSLNQEITEYITTYSNTSTH